MTAPLTDDGLADDQEPVDDLDDDLIEDDD